MEANAIKAVAKAKRVKKANVILIQMANMAKAKVTKEMAVPANDAVKMVILRRTVLFQHSYGVRRVMIMEIT